MGRYHRAKASLHQSALQYWKSSVVTVVVTLKRSGIAPTLTPMFHFHVCCMQGMSSTRWSGQLFTLTYSDQTEY